MNKTRWIVLLACLVIGLTPACIFAAKSLIERPEAAPPPAKPPQAAAVEPVASKPEPEPEPEPEPTRVTLLAAGDNLIHDVIYQQANRRAGGDGYDFTPLYERVADEIARADIAFINQETIMDDSRPPSGYPAFNTPSVMAAQLAQVGFDVANLANNHMLDLGLSGLEASMDVLDSTPGLTRVGAWREGEDKSRVAVLEREGIKFAFVGFAEYTNVGGASMYRDRIVYTDDGETIEAQLAAAREAADVVVVSVHFGTENTTAPNAAQEAFAARMNELGADIVLGHHPHMVQPVTFLERGDGHRTLVFYSLGNFVSAQSRPDNLIGLMPVIPVEQDPKDGRITVGDPVCHAVVTQYGAGMTGLSIWPLEEYTAELASQHGVGNIGRFSMESIRELLKNTIDESFTVPGR